MCKYLFILILPFAIVNFANAQQENSMKSTISGGMMVYSARITLDQTEITSDTLEFNRGKSIFNWEKKPQEKERTAATAEGIETKSDISPHDSIGEYNLYDKTTDSLYSRKFIIDQIYLVKEKNPEIQWSIGDTTKNIGNYTATKATAHFRGRDYTAWFTPEIPVPYGPWKLVGLPGLILQAYDTDREIYFNAQKLVFNTDGITVEASLNGSEQVIGLAEYKNILADLKKRMIQKAQNIARKYLAKYPDADIQIETPEPKLMEMFGKTANDKK
tara:strand:+ start:941 stop:1759 length:819 start_codon:yes stop_codon:yes gene_type:complete